MKGQGKDMFMNFGILHLDEEESWESEPGLERAFLLIHGDAIIHSLDNDFRVTRKSCFTDPPRIIRMDRVQEATVESLKSGTEFAVQAIPNSRKFGLHYLDEQNIQDTIFGKEALEGTMERRVRTFFDASSAPDSNMVMGEAINVPGRWSSYPPHIHPQPEIYHYRFERPEGFGFSAVGDRVFYVYNRDTICIKPNCVHPQAAAPGFYMYFVWMIPHLEEARFGPDSREFLDEYSWLLDR
jgi:5-deoxy-glucuronate isomerase